MLRVRSSLLMIGLGACIARGDVVTTVSGSKLVVTGDSSPNAVAIEPALDGIAVVGLDGTLVDGSSEGVTVAGVQRLTVKLRNGNDRVTLTQVTFSNGLDLRLRRGNDSVVIDQVSGGSARIQTGNGYDAVRVFGPSRFNSLSVQTSNGNDLIVLDGVSISGDLDIDTGSEDDGVEIVGTWVDNDMDVRLGNDDDFLVLADVAVNDDTDLDGENGDDALVFSGYIWFGDDLDIDGFGDDWWW